MSTKTYAGYRFRATTQSSMVIRNGSAMYIVTPIDSDDDNVYTSRLGYPNSGDGPWLKASRVVDGHSSTEEFYNVGLYYRSGIIAFDVCNYDTGYHVQFSKSGSGLTRKISVRPDSNIVKNARMDGKTLRFDMYDLQVPHEAVYERELPFTWDGLLGIYNRRDFDAAVSVCMSIHADAKSARWGRVTHFVDQWVYNITSPYMDRRFVDDLTPPDSVFLDVLSKCRWYLDTGILPGSWAMGWETAYIEASKSLPQAATNMAANILEAAETLTALFSGNFGKVLPKNPKEAWLFYRYAYTTTKLDVDEVKGTFSRLTNLAEHNSAEVYGSYTRGGTTFRVGYEIDTAQMLPTEVSTTLQRFGLELNALNVWDMIPYSFVVDWFLPVSQVIEYFSDLGACRLDPSDLWFSMVTTIDNYEVFVRLPGRKLSTMPYLSLRQASNRTICMRIADSIALFAP